MFNFYCGYNRSIIDQALRGQFEVLDAILFGDHCVQLLGTADVIRASLPKLPIYTHMSFWQEPELIDLENPVLGMAQNYLICPNNHGAPIMIGEIERLCDKFKIDGMVMHAARTCRGMTNSQFLIADSAKRHGRQALFFEGDVADESFYKDELLNVRLEAMVEALDAKARAA